MNKIGILTFHASHNCGSMMQAYAMQKVLEKKGYNSEIIDFSNEGQRDMYAVVHKKKNMKNFIKNTILFPHKKNLKRQWDNYENFKNQNMRLSREKYSVGSELSSTNEIYDCFISGADQIWNVTIKDSDDSYFLNFVNSDKKKIAYAPSFGARNISEFASDPQKYAEYLRKYDCLSVRENNGQKWIKELIGKEVEVVLDPTLLLERKDYEKLINPSNISGKYIFYYAPTYRKNTDNFVKKLSRKYKLPVVVWNLREYYLKSEFINGFKLPENQDPGVYLDLIKNAELVITTSFHGTIFSTMYKNKFWVLKNRGMYGNDDRVLTLVNGLGIADRLIEPEFDENKDYMEEVNYKTYNENLIKLKEKSIKYLMESLESND